MFLYPSCIDYNLCDHTFKVRFKNKVGKLIAQSGWSEEVVNQNHVRYSYGSKRYRLCNLKPLKGGFYDVIFEVEVQDYDYLSANDFETYFYAKLNPADFVGRKTKLCLVAGFRVNSHKDLNLRCNEAPFQLKIVVQIDRPSRALRAVARKARRKFCNFHGDRSQEFKCYVEKIYRLPITGK